MKRIDSIWGAIIGCLAIIALSLPGRASAQVPEFIGDVPPDLAACQNDGWQDVVSDLFSSFADEASCLYYAALGGSLNPSSAIPEAEFEDFYITNRSNGPLQISA